MKQISCLARIGSLVKRFRASRWWLMSIGLHLILLFILVFIFTDYMMRGNESIYRVCINPAEESKPAEQAIFLPMNCTVVETMEKTAEFDTNSPLVGTAVYDTIGIGGSMGGGRRHGRRGMKGSTSTRPGPAHGGSKIVNDEAYDATFFKNYGVNPFVDTEDDHLSTFATDVDTASYTVARAYLKDGHLPINDSVRTEEFINFFDYGYQPPTNDTFAIYLDAAPSKFGKNCFLQRIGIKGKEISVADRKDAILTFVIDCSGSMGQYDTRLELVKKSLRLLVEQLREGDRIGITTYQTKGSVLMEHKGISAKQEILDAIDRLHADGSTNAYQGLKLGYEIANKAFQRNCINRLILCTDGVANEGQTNADDILKEMKPYIDKGICLSAIGFGMDNYNDILLEKLGDQGNGHYAYVDTIMEAQRVFVENLTGTLQIIARDVKVQVDFNPTVVRSYRLLGYENRDVADNKFRDDKQKGGAIGSGFSVTALYEVKLWEDRIGKVATVYIRSKHPDKDEVSEISREINGFEVKKFFALASASFKLSAAAAQFAEILRHSYWAKDEKIDDLLDLAQSLAPAFKNDAKVIELVDLISKAKALTPPPESMAKDTEKDK